MKVVGHILGRLVVLFPQEEVRPIHGVPTVEAMASIAERYDFVHQPDLTRPISEFQQQGYQFADGMFTHEMEDVKILEFVIYNDGVSVSSYSTYTAELFFEDFMRWSQKEYRVKSIDRTPIVIYRSQITVEFAKPLSCLFRGFETFSQALSVSLGKYTSVQAPVDMIRMGLGVDESKRSSLGYVPFSLERRNQIPFENECYFSEAPLPSATHLKLLEELEAAMLEER